jgi:hypothetical protein
VEKLGNQNSFYNRAIEVKILFFEGDSSATLRGRWLSIFTWIGKPRAIFQNAAKLLSLTLSVLAIACPLSLFSVSALFRRPIQTCFPALCPSGKVQSLHWNHQERNPKAGKDSIPGVLRQQHPHKGLSCQAEHKGRHYSVRKRGVAENHLLRQFCDKRK